MSTMDEEHTDDLLMAWPWSTNPTLRYEVERGLNQLRPYYDSYGNPLVTADSVLECLRRFGIVYAELPHALL